MGYVRALLFICFGIGLFVQVAAQAAALPQPSKMDAIDCSQMMQRTVGDLDLEEGSSRNHDPCDEMTLDCLIAMNCLPPLNLTSSPSDHSPLPGIGTVYPAGLAVRLEHRALRPESPPPKAILAS